MKKEINIKDHILVPKHVKISKEELDSLLSVYNISMRQLPRISIKDATIKDLDVKAGDVIKIIRKSPTQQESIFYRAVAGD